MIFLRFEMKFLEDRVQQGRGVAKMKKRKEKNIVVLLQSGKYKNITDHKMPPLKKRQLREKNEMYAHAVSTHSLSSKDTKKRGLAAEKLVVVASHKARLPF